jgi:hypothetical protein
MVDTPFAQFGLLLRAVNCTGDTRVAPFVGLETETLAVWEKLAVRSVSDSAPTAPSLCRYRLVRLMAKATLECPGARVNGTIGPSFLPRKCLCAGDLKLQPWEVEVVLKKSLG